MASPTTAKLEKRKELLIHKIEERTDFLKDNLIKRFEEIGENLEDVKQKFLVELEINKKELINDVNERATGYPLLKAKARLEQANKKEGMFVNEQAIHDEIFDSDEKLTACVESSLNFLDKNFQATMSSIGRFNVENLGLDLSIKLKNLNNPKYLLRVKLHGQKDPKNLIKKYVDLFNKNTIFLLHETFTGCVQVVTMRTFNLDGHMDNQVEIIENDYTGLLTCKLNDNYVVLLFKPKNGNVHYTMQVYDTKLKLVNSKVFESKIVNLFLNENKFYLMRRKCIETYSYQFKFLKTYEDKRIKDLAKHSKSLIGNHVGKTNFIPSALKDEAKNITVLEITDDIIYYVRHDKNDDESSNVFSELYILPLDKKSKIIPKLEFERNLVHAFETKIYPNEATRELLLFNKPNNLTLISLDNGDKLFRTNLLQEDEDSDEKYMSFNHFKKTDGGNLAFIDYDDYCLFIN